MNCTPDDVAGPEQLLHYGFEVGANDNKIADNNGPIFCLSTEEVLTDGVLSALQRKVPVQSNPDNYGIASFIKAKTIIKVHYAE